MLVLVLVELVLVLELDIACCAFYPLLQQLEQFEEAVQHSLCPDGPEAASGRRR